MARKYRHFVYDENMKENYKSSILSEADYEYLMAGAKNEGLEQGLEQGRAVGEHERALMDAANFKAAGVSSELIASCTGLPVEVIDSL